MPVSAFVEPKNRSAEQWLRANLQKLDEAFRKIHVWDPVDSANAEHPHGVSFDEGIDTESDLGYVWVPCHWDKPHATRTVGNLRAAMWQLGAVLDDFRIDTTAPD